MVAKVWRQKLDYVKNLQAKYFTGKNILIYGSRHFGTNFVNSLVKLEIIELLMYMGLETGVRHT